MKERLIFHVDVNSAYLSWEAVHQLKNGAPTDIRTIPSIIGGDTSLVFIRENRLPMLWRNVLLYKVFNRISLFITNIPKLSLLF